MKKWYVLIGISIFLFLFSNMKTETSSLVFEEKNGVEFKLEQIDVSNTSITTKNIASLLDSLTLYKVTYEIPKLYQYKFTNSQIEYSLKGISKEKALSEIEKTLSNEMKQLGSTQEVERISFYGVKLVSIEVYGRVKEIEELKQKLKDY